MEYHICVKRSVQRSFPASPALLLIFLLPVLLVSLSPAQHNSASATSSSYSHAVSGVAPSAISFSHSNSLPGASSSKTSPSTNGWSHNHEHPRHGASNGNDYYPYLYLYGLPVPYAADDASPSDDDDDDAEYQGGPTIFDRRGWGSESYVPPSYEGPAHAQTQEASSEPQRIPTRLIFKDGHQLEIDNYAVVGQTLYDLSPGHSRRIALADLDLRATEKENDARGVTFELPSSVLAN